MASRRHPMGKQQLVCTRTRTRTHAHARNLAGVRPGEGHIIVAVLLSTVFTASVTITTHSKLQLDCNAKASNAIVKEPHFGKPDSCSSVSFKSRICASVPKSKME
eukprot:1245316-Amphidinium_carterae.1